MLSIWLGVRAVIISTRTLRFALSFACKILIGIAFFYASYLIASPLSSPPGDGGRDIGEVVVLSMSFAIAAFCVLAPGIGRAVTTGFAVWGFYALAVAWYLYADGADPMGPPVLFRVATGAPAFVVGLLVRLTRH